MNSRVLVSSAMTTWGGKLGHWPVPPPLYNVTCSALIPWLPPHSRLHAPCMPEYPWCFVLFVFSELSNGMIFKLRSHLTHFAPHSHRFLHSHDLSQTCLQLSPLSWFSPLSWLSPLSNSMIAFTLSNEFCISIQSFA